MWKFYFLIFVALGVTWATPRSKSSNSVWMKSFVVKPSRANPEELIRFRDSKTSDKYFFQGGPIQGGNSIEVLVPKYTEEAFEEQTNDANLRTRVKFDMVKMKYYGQGQWGRRLRQEPPAECELLADNSSCSENSECCSDICGKNTPDGPKICITRVCQAEKLRAGSDCNTDNADRCCSGVCETLYSTRLQCIFRSGTQERIFP